MITFILQQSQAVTLWDVITAYFVGHDRLLGTMAFATNRTAVSLQIVFLAGLSDAIGNSVILLANRVRPLRFVLALLANALLFLFGYLEWAFFMMVIASRIFNLNVEWPFFLTVVALGYIPLLFSALNFLPFLGYPISLLLYGISAIYLVRILNAATSLTLMNAFICAVVGFVLVELVRVTIGRPLIHIGQWFVSTAAGRRIEQNVEAALGIQGEVR